jgi:hypothetical protein
MSALQTYLAITPQSDEANVLRLLIELGIQVAGATEGSLLVHDRTANDLVFAMTVGGRDVLIGQRVPMSQGLTGLAAATREVQIGAPTFDIKQAEQRQDGPSAVIAAPMLVADELVGVITAVSFDREKRFSAADGDLYARLATVAALVVQQRRVLDAGQGVKAGDRDEDRVVAAVGRIARARPSALRHVATLLDGVEGLLALER